MRNQFLLVTIISLVSYCGGAAFAQSPQKNGPAQKPAASQPQPDQTSAKSPISKKKLEELRDLCQKRLKENPRDVETIVKLGSTYQFLNEYDKAIDQFNNALAIDPKNWKAFLGRSLMFSRKGLKAESAKDLQMALKYNPELKQTLEATMAHAKTSVAKALAPFYVDGEQGYYTSKIDTANDKAANEAREGKIAVAIKTLTDGINSFPSSKMVYKNQEYAKYCLSKSYQLRAFCNFKQKDLPKAIEDMTQAATLTPLKKEIYLDRSQLYAVTGDKVKAQADLEKAKTLKPDWMPAGMAAAITSSMKESMSYAAKRGHDMQGAATKANHSKTANASTKTNASNKSARPD